MASKKTVITILGSGGGVAKAVLAILNKSAADVNDPIHSKIKHAIIHLIDIKQKKLAYYRKYCPNLAGKLVLHEFDLMRGNLFMHHLRRTRTRLVIDVSWADTNKMLRCCNRLGVRYVNSALENTRVDEDEDLEGFTLIERYERFEPVRKACTNTTAIVCSGMNPGVVQWMALTLMKARPNKKPIGLYIVEHDNTFYANKAKARKDTLYTTWSVECFLDEAILSYPMLVRNKTPLFLYDDVYAKEYKVTLGNKRFYGCLMPHEESITLGKMLGVEVGFLYKINDHTTKLIRDNLSDVDDLWDWRQKVLDPADAALTGRDLVGVLLVYDDIETYMYNAMSNKTTYAKYKTNATYLQVACGIYGAVSSILLDRLPKGVFYVDSLLKKTKSNYGKYVSYHMKHFVLGYNDRAEGLLHHRARRFGRKPVMSKRQPLKARR
ncbi:S-adenosylmethionine decarboxylase related protein [Paenibacillus chartarius]|uniref:S-adenosylmethionine decarboxylase related protein n=1 Tax=Paenibacillus chartarius TaxID=747481 RepID=A0ABV6DVD5_9BACL